jgi:hypothetical protein
MEKNNVLNQEKNLLDLPNQTKYTNTDNTDSTNLNDIPNSNPMKNLKINDTQPPTQNPVKTSLPSKKPVISEPSTKESVPFWTQNPNIIFDKEYLLEFFPTSDMTLNQKLNAVTRSLIILTILGLFITKNQIQLVFIGFISILGVIAMFQYYKKDEGFDMNLENPNLNPALDYLAQNNLMDPDVPIFQKPDSTNPYGNVLVSDYELNPTKLPAPPITNAIVNDMVTQNAMKMVQEANPGQPDITNKLFRDLNEQLNFEQMNRQFVSNPATTIPNDQGAFAEFCYGSMISCKEGNLFACARNTSHYTNY